MAIFFLFLGISFPRIFSPGIFFPISGDFFSNYLKKTHKRFGIYFNMAVPSAVLSIVLLRKKNLSRLESIAYVPTIIDVITILVLS